MAMSISMATSRRPHNTPHAILVIWIRTGCDRLAWEGEVARLLPSRLVSVRSLNKRITRLLPRILVIAPMV